MKTFFTMAAFATLLGTAALPTSASALDLFHPFRPPTSQVNGRLNNEQRRINNGVSTGRLNPVQANRLERGEQHIQRQVNRDRAMHNGHLTWRDRMHLNRKENVQSRHINQAEHHNVMHRSFGHS
ncbi:MAG: hypothetical protein JWR15_2030 [Prosthecobacter sp.]|nr:hypothetical protein [Prosthecobacter sp.]